MSERRRRYHPLLVGAAFGVLCGDLLLGLNPHLLGAGSSARLLGLSLLCGALAGLPVALVPTGTERPSRLAWVVLAVALLGFAVFCETQRTLFYLSLGNGARRVLVAATLAAVAGALVSLLAALRIPDAPASTRALALLVGLFLVVPSAGRRREESSSLPRRAPLPRAATRSLLVVGLEGVSWELLSTALSDGSLPVLARLVREGAAGPLASLPPCDRAALWTSVATGKTPSKHGVVASFSLVTPGGDLRLLPRFPDGSRLPRPPFSRRGERLPRRSLAFWEILAERGHQAALLSWPASEPAREGLSLWATEGFFTKSPPGAGGALALPGDAAERARPFCVDASNLDRPLVRVLVPHGLPPGDEAAAQALEGAARDLTVLGTTLGSLPSGPRNVSALVLSGLVGPASRYGPAAEPQRYWGLSPTSGDARARALSAYYRLIDDILGDLMAREGEDRTICVFAPVGWGPPPPASAFAAFLAGREPEASADAGRDGFVLLNGPGIRQGVRLTSAAVLDLAPTLLALAGEPVARDLDGRVLAEVFDERFTESTSIPIVTTFEPGGPQ